VPEQVVVVLLRPLPLHELRELRRGQPHVRVAAERMPGGEQSLEDVRHLLVSRIVWRRGGQQGLLQGRRRIVRWLLMGAVGLCAVGTQLLGQGAVPVAEGGHQAGTVLHLNLAGTGADGEASPGRACSCPRHTAEHVNGLLYLDGHLLGLRRLLEAQAG